MLIELKDFEGWDFKGLWADLKFDVSHQEQMDRIAILGDKRWQDWGTTLSDPFFKAELKFFETDERAAAEACDKREESIRGHANAIIYRPARVIR